MVVMMMMSLCIRSEYLLIKVTSDFFLYQVYQTAVYFHQFHGFSLIYKMPVNTVMMWVKVIHVPVSSIPNPFFHFGKKYL